MIRLLGYGLYVGQTVNAELSFQIPKAWMFGVLGLTWIFNIGLISLYWFRVRPSRIHES